TILAVPLFILAAKLMNTSGITDRIFKFCTVLVGYLPGGLGHVNIASSIVFSGMSGAAVSDAAGLGQIEIKAMRKAGYDKGFSAAVTSASSTVGPIIPPSLPLVIYGVTASASVGALFLAGIVPGLIMGVLMMCLVAFLAFKRGYPRENIPTVKEFWTSFKKAILPLFTPIIIIGGIFSGYFTATEAAAVAVLYAYILGSFVYKELSIKNIINIVYESALEAAVLGLIVSAATIYGKVLIQAKIPQELLTTFTSLAKSPTMLLFIIIIFLLIIGCFLETVSAITILMPLLLPLLMQFEIDLIHFGIIMVMTLMIGVLTPPFGIVLFTISKIGNISIGKLVKELFPFYIILLIALL